MLLLCWSASLCSCSADPVAESFAWSGIASSFVKSSLDMMCNTAAAPMHAWCCVEGRSSIDILACGHPGLQTSSALKLRSSSARHRCFVLHHALLYKRQHDHTCLLLELLDAYNVQGGWRLSCHAGLKHLSALQQLSDLNLGYTRAACASVSALTSLSALSCLSLDSCDLTDQ